jgi:hypothetical protein
VLEFGSFCCGAGARGDIEVAGFSKRRLDARFATAAKTDNADLAGTCRGGANIGSTHADGMHMPHSKNFFATRAAHACASSHPATDATPACGLRSAFSSGGFALSAEFQSGKSYSFSV